MGILRACQIIRTLGLRYIHEAAGFFGALRTKLTIKSEPYGCFYKLGVLFVGVLMMRALLFGVYIRVLDCWKLSNTKSCYYTNKFYGP